MPSDKDIAETADTLARLEDRFLKRVTGAWPLAWNNIRGVCFRVRTPDTHGVTIIVRLKVNSTDYEARKTYGDCDLSATDIHAAISDMRALIVETIMPAFVNPLLESMTTTLYDKKGD